MYHHNIGFDALELDGFFQPDGSRRPAGVLEQGLAGRLLGLVLASDLFAARNPGPRAWLESIPLATCWEGADIRFSGERLDQDDLDAFLACALFAFHDGGKTGSARFHLRDLTRTLRPRGRRFAARRLERSLWRLASARLEIDDAPGRTHIQARLLNTLLCDREAGLCAVDVSPRIMEGLRDASSVERLLAMRANLTASAFHRWLAALVVHGPACLRLDLPALRRLCGLTRQPMPAFRIRAIAALQDFLDLGIVAAIEPAGPDRLVVSRPAARGEEPACLLLT